MSLVDIIRQSKLGKIIVAGGLAVVISLSYGCKEQKRPQIPKDTKTYQQSGERIISYNANGVALGDIDNDGDLDILATGDAGWNKGGIFFYENKNGKYSQKGVLLVPYNANGVALGDIDNDGDLDILATGDAGWNKGGIFLFKNNSGRFEKQGKAIAPYNGNGVALGDIDGDGDLDIVASGDAGWNKGGIYLHRKNSK